MAKSKQGTGKTAKRASASRSSGGKSRASQNRSGARASGSASRKTSSGRAQRRAQASNLGSSVALAGVGLLVIVPDRDRPTSPRPVVGVVRGPRGGADRA